LKKAIIIGGNELKGEIKIDGAKNSVLALLPAALMVNGKVTFENVPNISDIKSFLEIFDYLEIDYFYEKSAAKLTIHSREITNLEVVTPLVESFRASYYLMGVMLGRYKQLTISMPGGCKIGTRPVDYHLEGFKALGADVDFSGSTIILKAEKLIASEINFPRKSVGATMNLIYAACYAEGLSVIKNAALEPEIDDLIGFMNVLGFKVLRIQNDIHIEGMEKILNVDDISYSVVPDRIEAMSYVILGLLTGEIKVTNLNYSHIKKLIDLLKAHGADLEISDTEIIARKSTVKALDIVTEEYPGVPTDIAQILGVLLMKGDGDSVITETIFENRFESFIELNKLNCKNEIVDDSVKITGGRDFIGNTVIAKDLRGCASLVFAGLAAKFQTIVENIDYMERGYSNLYKKLSAVGANIQII